MHKAKTNALCELVDQLLSSPNKCEHYKRCASQGMEGYTPKWSVVPIEFHVCDVFRRLSLYDCSHNAFYKDVSLVIDVSCDVDRAAAETDGDISISWGWRGN